MIIHPHHYREVLTSMPSWYLSHCDAAVKKHSVGSPCDWHVSLAMAVLFSSI